MAELDIKVPKGSKVFVKDFAGNVLAEIIYTESETRVLADGKEIIVKAELPQPGRGRPPPERV